jgi:hypothetical protein
MANFLYNKRVPDKLIYIEYGNTYTVMNTVPYNLTGPKFEKFTINYGSSYRNNILFVICYHTIQYYVNAAGMVPYVNYTYIDAIAMNSVFGDLDPSVAYGLNDTMLKDLLIQQELAE